MQRTTRFQTLFSLGATKIARNAVLRQRQIENTDEPFLFHEKTGREIVMAIVFLGGYHYGRSLNLYGMHAIERPNVLPDRCRPVRWLVRLDFASGAAIGSKKGPFPSGIR